MSGVCVFLGSTLTAERAQKEQGAHIDTIYQMVEQLMSPSEVPTSRRIGFVTDDK